MYQVHLAFIDIVGNQRLHCLLMKRFAGWALKVAENLDRYGCDWDSASLPGGDCAALIAPAERSSVAMPTAHNTRVAWLLLLIAGAMEVGWAVGLKYTEGFTRLTPTLLTVGAMVISMALLGLAVRELPIGTAYAVWTGIGAIGTVVAGAVLMNEPLSFARGFCILLILAGIIGLKFTHA